MSVFDPKPPLVTNNGIILAILAINMVAGPGKKVVEEIGVQEDPERIAVYPLAIPYLLNPVGITILIIAFRRWLRRVTLRRTTPHAIPYGGGRLSFSA
jgi:small neutral amino acid transporter SnatA (MarC family)